MIDNSYFTDVEQTRLFLNCVNTQSLKIYAVTKNLNNDQTKSIDVLISRILGLEQAPVIDTSSSTKRKTKTESNVSHESMFNLLIQNRKLMIEKVDQQEKNN